MRSILLSKWKTHIWQLLIKCYLWGLGIDLFYSQTDHPLVDTILIQCIFFLSIRMTIKNQCANTQIKWIWQSRTNESNRLNRFELKRLSFINNPIMEFGWNENHKRTEKCANSCLHSILMLNLDSHKTECHIQFILMHFDTFAFFRIICSLFRMDLTICGNPFIYWNWVRSRSSA